MDFEEQVTVIKAAIQHIANNPSAEALDALTDIEAFVVACVAQLDEDDWEAEDSDDEDYVDPDDVFEEEEF
jgi:hypothetical protein